MAYGVAGVSTPAVSLAQSVQGPVPPTTETLNEAPQTDTTASIQIVHPADRQNLDPPADAEIDHRFNELRSELLDDRARAINWWLAVVGLVLTFFAIAVPLLGLLGYRRFKEIEKEAQVSAEEAKRFVEEIEQIRDKSHEYYQDMTAEKAVDDPAVEEKAEAVRKDPQASLMDKAVARAIFFQKEGKTEDAITIWRGIAHTTEGIDDNLAAGAWVSVGYLLSQEESVAGDEINLEEVLSAYNEALRLNPDHVGAYTNRGIAKAGLGRYQDAIADYNEAIRQKPDYSVAYYNRGITNIKLEQYQGAIADFNEAIRLKRNYAEAYYNRGIANAKTGQYQDAFADFSEAIKLRPDLAEAHYNRGVSNRKLGLNRDAIVDFDEAIRLKPDDAGAYNNRGVAKTKLGRTAAARADFERALEIAKKAGDAETVSKAEENLRALDSSEGA